ncbi:MAG TPA: hypothetical protein PLH15_05920 [Spirochaetota bacterium]|nr:hypothetical protein [Spirochaetota bacterium]HQQ23358.1 hypothetical protein [Spirochaetota bacterium]
MSTVMEFTKEQLEQIGSYIESNIDRFGAKSNVIQLRPYDIQLIERMTRIEEELRSQREIILKQNETMQFGFTQMDKRFESMQKQMDERFAAVDKRFDDVNKRFNDVNKRFDDVNKRFDDVNKRFSMMMWMMTAGFTIIATVITLLSIFAR